MMNNPTFIGIEAVIFDFDGTLVDSKPIWKEINKLFLAQLNLPYPSGLEQELEGKSYLEIAEYFITRFNLSQSPESIIAYWNQLNFNVFLKEMQFKKGAKELLEKLKNYNYKLGIASSNSVELIDSFLKRSCKQKYFTSIRTPCEGIRSKPYPDLYQYVALDLDVIPSKCLVFEDSLNGILAGNRAGMRTCSVYDDSASHDIQKIMKKADFSISDFRDLV